MLKVLTHAAIIFAITNVIGAFAGSNPGVHTLLNLVALGAYVPFSLALAAGLHRHLGIALLTLAVVFLLAWPTATIVPLVLPVAIGTLLGSLGRKLLVPEVPAS